MTRLDESTVRNVVRRHDTTRHDADTVPTMSDGQREGEQANEALLDPALLYTKEYCIGELLNWKQQASDWNCD